jgi:hypothetical protein
MSATESKNNPIKNPLVKNILATLAVAVFGFIMLTLTFLFFALISQVFDRIVRINVGALPRWVPIARYGVFLVIIVFISWLVFRSRLWTLIKAIYLTVPTASVLAIIGIALNAWPVLMYAIGGVITLAVLAYFYITKKPWLYFYSMILVALTLMVYTLTGGEI